MDEDVKKLVEDYTEASKDKTLYDKVLFMFNTLWYDTGIVDFGASFLGGALDISFPSKDDTDKTLEAKMYLLSIIAENAPFIEAVAISEFAKGYLMKIAQKEDEEFVEKVLSTPIDEL